MKQFLEKQIAEGCPFVLSWYWILVLPQAMSKTFGFVPYLGELSASGRIFTCTNRYPSL